MILTIPLLTYILRNNVKANSGGTLESNSIDEKNQIIEKINVVDEHFAYDIAEDETEMKLDKRYYITRTENCNEKVIVLHMGLTKEGESSLINIQKHEKFKLDYTIHETTIVQGQIVKRIQFKIPLFENRVPLIHKFLFENLLYNENIRKNFILDDLFYEITYMLQVLSINADHRDSFILFSKIINTCLNQIVIDENDNKKFEPISNSFKNFLYEYINCIIFDKNVSYDALKAYYKLVMFTCSVMQDMLIFEINLIDAKRAQESVIEEQSKLALICQNYINTSKPFKNSHQTYIVLKKKIEQIETRSNCLKLELNQLKNLQTNIITARADKVDLIKNAIENRNNEINQNMNADTTNTYLKENKLKIDANIQYLDQIDEMTNIIYTEVKKLNDFKDEMISRVLDHKRAPEASHEKFNAMPFIYKNAENVCDILGTYKHEEKIYLIIKEFENTPAIITKLFSQNYNDFIDFDNYDSKFFVVEMTKIIETILINMDKKENIKSLANLTNTYFDKFNTLYDNKYKLGNEKQHLLDGKKDIRNIFKLINDKILTKLTSEQENDTIIKCIVEMITITRKLVIDKNIDKCCDSIKLIDEYHKLCIYLNSYLYPGVKENVTVKNNVFEQNPGFDVNTRVVALIVNIIQDFKKIKCSKNNNYFLNFNLKDFNNIEFCIINDDKFIITSEMKKTYFYKNNIDKTINTTDVKLTHGYFEQFNFEMIQVFDTILINYQEYGIDFAKKLCEFYKNFLCETRNSIFYINIKQKELMITKINRAIAVIQNIIYATQENFITIMRNTINFMQQCPYFEFLPIKYANQKILYGADIVNKHDIDTEIYEGSSIIFYILRKDVDVKLRYFSSSNRGLLNSEIPIFTQQKAHFITLQLFEMLVLNIFNSQKTNKLLQEVQNFYITVKNRIENQEINNVEKDKIAMILENSAEVIQIAINELNIKNKLIESVDKRENVLNIIYKYLDTLENSLNNSQEYTPIKNSYTHLLGLIAKWQQYLKETLKKNDWKSEFKIDLYAKIQKDINNYYALTQGNDMKLREFRRYASNNTKRNEQQQIDTAGSSNLSHDDNVIFSPEKISDNDLEYNLKKAVDELVRKVNNINKTNNIYYPQKSYANTTHINIENMKKNNKSKFEEELKHLSQQFETNYKKILEAKLEHILKQSITENKKIIKAELQLLRKKFENTNNSSFGAGSNQNNNENMKKNNKIKFEENFKDLQQQSETNYKKILEDEVNRVLKKFETKNKKIIEDKLKPLCREFEDTNNNLFEAGYNQINIIDLRKYNDNIINEKSKRLRKQFETDNKKTLIDDSNLALQQFKTYNQITIEAELQRIRQVYGNTINSIFGARFNKYNIENSRFNINNTIEAELIRLRKQFGSTFATNLRYLYELDLTMKQNGYVLCHGFYLKTKVYTCYI